MKNVVYSIAAAANLVASAWLSYSAAKWLDSPASIGVPLLASGLWAIFWAIIAFFLFLGFLVAATKDSKFISEWATELEKENKSVKDAAIQEVESNYKFYKENKEKLLKHYNGKWMVLKSQFVAADFDNDVDAYEYGMRTFGSGKFSVQKCIEVDEVQVFHSPRVIFNSEDKE